MRLVRLPEEKGKKAGKRRRGGDGGEDILGGLGGSFDFGELKGEGKRRRREEGAKGERMGERWEKRVGRGVGRKRR